MERGATIPEKLTVCGHTDPCGCDEAACCVECPLPVCKFDSFPARRHILRDFLIRAGAAAGATRTDIAAAAHMSERSVYRVLQEAK